MKRPNKSVVVQVAVVAVAFGAVIVWKTLGCSPPRDQADMIKLYQADPFFAAAPFDGQLVDEYAHTNACDAAHDGGSPLGPGFAEVRRQYKVPVVYSLDQLRQQFDQPAAAAGWHFQRSESFGSGSSFVAYCKQTEQRASTASVHSSNLVAEGKGANVVVVPGVEVYISSGGEEGLCGDER